MCKPSDVNKESQTALLPKWHPIGPNFEFSPYPVIDVTRLWGSPCDSCGSQCTGHYVTDIPTLLRLRQDNMAIRALPPSITIEEAFKKATVNNTIALGKKCCLSTEEVEIWLSHLQKKAITRKQAVEKARQTRARNKENIIIITTKSG